jgi:hypothetical protein
VLATLQIVLGALCLVPLLCLVHWIWATFKSPWTLISLDSVASAPSFEPYWRKAGRSAYIILVMLAACVVVGAGCYQFLFWLPDTLGRFDEFGEWTSTRYLLSCFGATGGLWLMLELSKTAEKLYWQHCEKIMLDEYRMLVGVTPERLQSEYTRLRAKLEASNHTVLSLTGSAKAKENVTREAYAALVSALRQRVSLID